MLDMLDADAATEMLNWGIAMVTALVKKTEGMDDATAEQILEPQLKAVRLTMRSGGNWAAGKYEDPTNRASLQTKLAEYRSVIFGEHATILPDTVLASLLNQVDDKSKTPLQLVQNLKSAMGEL